MKRLLYILSTLIVALTLLIPAPAYSEAPIDEDDANVYTLSDESGKAMMRHAGRIYVDDEYISGDDMLYRVISVDDQAYTAVAKLIGEEPFDGLGDDETVFSAFSANAEESPAPSASADPNAENGAKKLICMYSTHSDESYVPSDGTSSKMSNAGIFDVGDALKANLEKKGIEVEYSKENHLPHDAGAYRRSRRTAEELLKMQPTALIDIHRDGIPDPDEYHGEVDGEDITKVRLLVGRSNPSASANRSFAKQIKKTADNKYPGLIKDIFIGKGNYNQELYPKSILLEFGTHVTSKEKAEKSTAFVADTLNDVLFGGSAQAAPTEEGQAVKAEENKSAGTGIAWFVGIAIVGAIIYALVATGTFKGMGTKLARGTSEITGGIIGKKPEDEE